MAHVDEVTVSRCGDWYVLQCPGNERGCSRCHDPSEPVIGPYRTLCDYDIAQREQMGLPTEGWRDQPHPTTLTHAEFLRDYGRCPDTCRIAEQLSLL